MFRKKIQAVSGSFQYRRPTQPSPTFSARTMRSAQSALQANRTHSHGLWKLRGTWHTLHPVPIVRQVRQVRPVRPVRHSLLPPCALRNVLCQLTEHTAMGFGNSGAHCTHTALCYRNSKAHGTQAAIDHLQYSRYSQYSWFLCSHPVPCAKCFASRWENAMHREAPWAKGGHFLGKKLVPAVGVEPTRLLPVDFESTASAIPPRWHLSVLHKNA